MNPEHNCSTADCHHCPTRSLGLFAEASPDGLDRLSQARLTRHYSAGQTLVCQGNRPTGIHCIARGKVKLYNLTESGQVQILRWLGPGETVGEAEFLSSLPHGATAEAVEEVETCFIDGGALRHVLEHEPQVARELICRLSEKLLRTQEQLVSSSHTPVRTRVAELLLEQHCSSEPFTSSRKEMSQLLGITPETLARILTEFQEAGLIEKDRRRISIPAPQLLESWITNSDV